jgi:hypothetical protein
MPHVHQFLAPDNANAIIDARRRDDTAHRPHASLGDLTPTGFAHRPQDFVTPTER